MGGPPRRRSGRRRRGPFPAPWLLDEGGIMSGLVQGKVVIVTGAASGIGSATTRLLLAEGAKVLATDIDDKRGA
ncbi:MAG: SDR family NAD(P)-dependent oxidoreductase, partial [Bradyrhizobium sp.]